MSRVKTAAADGLAVVLFVVLGRGSHGEGSVIGGTLATAWPFLVGLAVGWGVLLGTGRRPDRVGSGALVLVATVALGMALRRLAGGGTPLSFVLVATGVLAIFILGWRIWLDWRVWLDWRAVAARLRRAGSNR